MILTKVVGESVHRTQEHYRQEHEALSNIPREAIERIARIAGIKLPPGNSAEYWRVARIAAATVAADRDELGLPRTILDGALLLGGHTPHPGQHSVR